jgi:L-iditol 2-dehydrogenase
LLHIKLAKALGASSVVVTDINKRRLVFAEKFGARAGILANDNMIERLKEINNGHLAHVVIVATGALEAISTAWKATDRGGTILLFAPTEPGVDIPVPLFDLWHDGLTITTSYAGSPSDITEAIELIRSKTIPVKDMITHRFPLARAGEGFSLVEKAQDSIKVIIEP